MPHMRCDECGYAWRGSNRAPLSRCPNCGRSDKLVRVEEDAGAGEEPAQEQQPAEPDEEMGGFTASTELAMVATIFILLLIIVAAGVMLLFWVSSVF